MILKKAKNKTIKEMLSDFYEIRKIIEAINYNYKNDVDNPMMADKHRDYIEESIGICNKWVNQYQP